MSHTLLSHTKVSGTTTSEIDITGIDQTYQDLCFWFVGHASSTSTYEDAEIYFHLDGDTAAHYTHQAVWTLGTSKYAAGQDNGAEFMFAGLGNAEASNNSGGIVYGYIPGYTSTTSPQGHTLWMWSGSVANSTVGTVGSMISQYTGQWTEETAIDEIKVSYPGTYFAENSTFSLYGVTNS